VKAYQGELANEGAYIPADKAISHPKVGKKWCQRTNRAVFQVEKAVEIIIDLPFGFPINNIISQSCATRQVKYLIKIVI